MGKSGGGSRRPSASVRERKAVRTPYQLRGFQAVQRPHYMSEAQSAGEHARRAVNEIANNYTRRGKAWEEKIAASERNRYQRGDESVPNARSAPAHETLNAENKRLAEDLFRTHIWLDHGPGETGRPSDAQMQRGIQQYRTLTTALNDNIQRSSAARASKLTADALRTYRTTPGVRDLLDQRPIAVRFGGTVHVIQPTAPLGPRGISAHLYRLGEAKPYESGVYPLDFVRQAMNRSPDAFAGALATNWRPVMASRSSRIGQVAAAYRDSHNPDAEKQLLAYNGVAPKASGSGKSRAKKAG